MKRLGYLLIFILLCFSSCTTVKEIEGIKVNQAPVLKEENKMELSSAINEEEAKAIEQKEEKDISSEVVVDTIASGNINLVFTYSDPYMTFEGDSSSGFSFAITTEGKVEAIK